MLALGTLLRYVVNYGFVAVSKIDSWTERIKVHRERPRHLRLRIPLCV